MRNYEVPAPHGDGTMVVQLDEESVKRYPGAKLVTATKEEARPANKAAQSPRNK